MYIVKSTRNGCVIRVRFHRHRQYKRTYLRYSFVQAIIHEKTIYCHKKYEII